MKQLALALMLMVLSAAPSTARAQAKLPAEFVGTGIFSGRAIPWTLVIESQGPEGAITGKVTWHGINCSFENQPVNGVYRGERLEVLIPATSPRCGRSTITLVRSRTEPFVFEGNIDTEGLSAGQVRLRPRSIGSGAQQPAKLYRVAMLLPDSPSESTVTDSVFKAAMEVLGYEEGRNLVLDRRWIEGRTERFPALAAELTTLKPDAIVAVTTPGARAARQATASVPIVMLRVSDPVGAGLVASLAHPGGNVTGLTDLGVELASKHLELAHALDPKATRIAVLVSDNPVHPTQLTAIEVAARSLGISVMPVTDRSDDELRQAFASLAGRNVAALIVLGGALENSQARQIAMLATAMKLPTISGDVAFVRAGGLLSYGSRDNDFGKAASYVDKILRGAKPGDLAVEQPSKIALFINLKTAKALGLAIPQSLLLRADEVIQ